LERRWIILLVLFLARTAMGFQFQSIASTAPFLIDSLNLNYAQIGTLIGAYFLVGALISLPGGLVIQRIGDKGVCAAGLLLMVVGGLLLAMSADFATALVGRLVGGTGSVLFNLVLTKMTTDWFAKREIVFAMAVILASWPFGIAAGLLLQPPLAEHLGWPAVMEATAALCALTLLLVVLAYRSPPPEPGAAAPILPARAMAWPPAAKIPPVAVAGIIWGNTNIGLVLFFSFAPGLLREFGYSTVASASLPSYALWIVMLSVPLGGLAIERLGRPDAAIVACAIPTALTLALLAADLAPPVACAAFGVVMGIPAGAVMALPARVLSAEHRASGLGIFFAIYYGLMSVGPAVAGWLRDTFGTSAAALIFAAILYVAIVPLLGLFQRLATRAQVEATALSPDRL
jgi:predicted MFS family arabinose efflux permease